MNTFTKRLGIAAIALGISLVIAPDGKTGSLLNAEAGGGGG